MSKPRPCQNRMCVTIRSLRVGTGRGAELAGPRGWVSTDGWRYGRLLGVALLAPSPRTASCPRPAAHATPSGFQETTVISGLTNPTVVRFAPDGRVFVAEKSGLIKVFDSLSGHDPDDVRGPRTNVHNFWDRGLLGMALASQLPGDSYVYVLYSLRPPARAAPPPVGYSWRHLGRVPDTRRSDDGRLRRSAARLSRLQADGNVMTGTEQVLVEDWCQQYPSHSVGTVEFGPDGMLYARAGDGASFIFADYGQVGNLNPCGDPGGSPRHPPPKAARSGARTCAPPAIPSGSTGRSSGSTRRPAQGLPTNPLAGSPDPNARRIIAHGLRNPFRFAFRPGTKEFWVGDVGWGRLGGDQPDPRSHRRRQWRTSAGPATRGPRSRPATTPPDLAICENLYAQPTPTRSRTSRTTTTNKVVAGRVLPDG